MRTETNKTELLDAFNSMKRLCNTVIQVLSQSIKADIHYKCTCCKSMRYEHNQVLFTRESIVFRASFLCNVLNEIQNIKFQDISDRVSVKDISDIKEHLIKKNLFTNLDYIFNGDVIQMREPCARCSCTIFDQRVEILTTQQEETKNVESDEEELSRLLHSMNA